MHEPSVSALQERINSREFAEWVAYDELEPFGEDRADRRAAMLAMLIVNMNPNRKQSISMRDCLDILGPVSDVEPPVDAAAAQTPAAQLEFARQLAAAFGAAAKK